MTEHWITAEQARWMVRVATLAPSLLNTQPWGFAIRGDQIEIRADDGRWVPSIDPSKRLMILSCGAALLNLRLAMSHAAWTPLVEAFPDDDDPGLVARVRRGSARAISDQDELLLSATERRRTNRRPFSGQPIPPATLSQIVAATETEDAEGVLVTGMDAIELRGIFKLAEREAGADPDVAAALSQWIRETSGHDDGLTLDVLGPVPRGTASARDFLHGEHREERGDSDFEADPTLLVIATSEDTRTDWLTAGQALERVQLTATVLGVASSYLGQPFESVDLRTAVAHAAPVRGVPQMIMRLGYGPDSQPTPRRPVSDVLV